jgi:hypothetical protein
LVPVPEPLLHALETIRQNHTMALSTRELIESALEWYLDNEEARTQLKLHLGGIKDSYDSFPPDPGFKRLRHLVSGLQLSWCKNSDIAPHPSLNPFARDFTFPDDPQAAVLVSQEGIICDFMGSCFKGREPSELIGKDFLTVHPPITELRRTHLKRVFELNTYEHYEFQFNVGRTEVTVHCVSFRVELDRAIVLQWYSPNLSGGVLSGYFVELSDNEDHGAKEDEEIPKDSSA